MEAEKINMVMEVIDGTLRDPSKPWDKPFGWMEDRTGVSRFRQLLIIVFGVAHLLLLSCGMVATVTSNAIGFSFPAYMTVALMETPRTSASYTKAVAEATTKWLAYWPAFAAILIIEQHIGFILKFVPYYLLFKTLFLVWCSAPIKNNAIAILHTNVSPYLEKLYD